MNDVPEPRPEPWMRGIVPGLDPVLGHLHRAVQHIREDAAATLADLTPTQIWARPHGLTSAGFHAKHLAGSTERLSTYLTGQQLTPQQLATIPTESTGDETFNELLTLINASLDHYEDLLRNLTPQDFGAIREIGRRRYQTTAISLAIHIAEHAQRHIGGLIAAAKLARVLWSSGECHDS